MKDETEMRTFTEVILKFIVASSFILHPSSFVGADGGAMRLREQAGAYQVTVFTSPTPFRAGLVDVSVLVLDTATGECLPEARVTVRLTARGTGEVLEYPASAAAATNKLFHAAVFQLPEPGWWEVKVAVEGPRGPAVLWFGLEAGETPPPWRGVWAGVAAPGLPVAVFCLLPGLCWRGGFWVESAGAEWG